MTPHKIMHVLQGTPQDRLVVLFMRHAARAELPDDPKQSFELPITAEGREEVSKLGHCLGGRLRSVHASPLQRTMQTASCLADGAGQVLQPRIDHHLGHPGVYVLDSSQAGSTWNQHGTTGIVSRLARGDYLSPAFASPGHASRFLALHMLAASGHEPGVHAFVSHDALIATAMAHLLNDPAGPERRWPGFLDAALLWREDDGVRVRYQSHDVLIAEPLCCFNEDDVLELARREVLAAVGLGCPARFFLAGGCFKTLLTGQAPRDLDLWAPTPEDRALLVASLLKRGATTLKARPFADAYRMYGRIVEIPHSSGPSALEDRLATFDIALSAIGVEHLPGGEAWRVVIHPLALESVRQRQVLLLKPLANWKYALTTLERARRYACELDYCLPEQEQKEIWRAVLQAPLWKMLERYYRAGGRDESLVQQARHCYAGVEYTR